MNTKRQRERRRVVRTYEDVCGALRRLGGDCCNFHVDVSTFHSHDPGSCLVETTWRASLRIRDGRNLVATVNAEAKTPAALVAEVRRRIRDRLTDQAQYRRDSQVPALVYATAELRRIG